MHWGTSNEYPQNMSSGKNKLKILSGESSVKPDSGPDIQSVY